MASVFLMSCILTIQSIPTHSKYIKTCNITNYGAKGDGRTDNTKFIQKAINDCSNSTKNNTSSISLVLIPSYYTNNVESIYISGAVWLDSNIELSIEKNVRLLALPCINSTQNNISFPLIYSRMSGIMQYQYSSLINGGICKSINYNASAFGDQCKKWKKLENIIISGEGTIDGNGESGWFDPKLKNRPLLLDLIHIKNLHISGLTLTNSAHVVLRPLFSDNIFVENITITTWGENTAGFYPDSSTNAVFQNSFVSTGDDNICVKSGFGDDGIAVNVSSNNITIRNVILGNGHGLTVGSECVANCTNIIFDNCTADGTGYGPKVKSGVQRGGLLENITYSNIILKDVGTGLILNDYYNSKDTNVTGPPWPDINHIYYINITGSVTKEAGNFSCISKAPCHDIILDNIDIKCDGNADGFDCNDVYGKSTNVQPKSCIASNYKHL